MSTTLGKLAKEIDAVLHGNPELVITGCAPIEHAGPEEVTFLANSKYTRHLGTTRAAAVLVDEKTLAAARQQQSEQSGGSDGPAGPAWLIVDDPYFAFRNTLIALYGFRQHPPIIGTDDLAPPSGAVGPASVPADAPAIISPAAHIHPDAVIGAGVHIHPGVVVEQKAVVGPRCVLYPGVYIGAGVTLGSDCVLYPNVSVYDGCVLGDRVTLHASTVIGQDGFGYATHKGEHHKIPQTGIVVIEDDVEMGAGCAIERAAMGETRIGKGTKFADLISIGHGTKIGSHCLFVSLVGVSGSVEIGNYVVLGGQVGVAGHLKIGDGVQAMARTAIARDIPAGQKVGGVPAVPADLAKRNALAALDLYEMSKRVRKLERELAELHGKTSRR